MAASLVKVNGTEVSVEDSGKSVMNITICQESSLSYLVKAVTATGRKRLGQMAPAPRTPDPSAPTPLPSRAPCSGEQKVLGGAQILLGVMCLGLGGVLCPFNDYLPVRRFGTPFWMGSLFVVSGSLCVLSERRGGRCWVHLATFFSLASTMAGCVGLALGVLDLPYLQNTPFWMNEVCGKQGGYVGWRPSPAQRCRDTVLSLLNVVSGVQILLLISSVAALGMAAFCFGYGLRILCCTLQDNTEDRITTGDLEVPLAGMPPPYEELAKENTAA
ncbi:transmembrane protein 176A-like [Heteronotia binoei]|uniref:transmembrane protein 176A-like n=1 Tax=Heteronotia binoei TaxID=13085 RepID=UPI00292F0B20|nr:transmembrane protein 176A-like [Heteronotia binoei]